MSEIVTSHVALDLETLGTSSNSVIVAIGAVMFDPFDEPRTFIKSFYETINVQSCLDAGLSVDGSTVEWWMKQSEAARDALTFRKDLKVVLDLFDEWFGDASQPLWGNGSAFDCVILGNAYEKCSLQRPWKFFDEMCLRTVRRAFPTVGRVRPIIPHHALYDAEAQAATLQRIFRFRQTDEDRSTLWT